MYDVIVTEQARRDPLEACAWYENERPGLGHEFWLDAMKLLDVMATNPHAAPAVTINGDVRKRVMRRFPYRLYVGVHEKTVSLLAVYHTARNPRRWDDPTR